MTDRSKMNEASLPANGETHPDPVASASLEQRVRRLEDVVAGIQDTQQLEERITERVSDRIRREPKFAIKESAGLLVNAGRQLLPAALTMMHHDGENTDKPGMAEAANLRRSWLVFDAYTEARAMVRMFFDHRYRVSWWSRVAPSMLFVAILTSWIWLPGTSILPSLISVPLVKAVDVVLAFLAYKILSREVCRYLDTVNRPAALPPP